MTLLWMHFFYESHFACGEKHKTVQFIDSVGIVSSDYHRKEKKKSKKQTF